MDGVISATDQQMLVSSFLEIAVGQNANTARQFLQATSWNLEEAIQLSYIGNEGGAAASVNSPQLGNDALLGDPSLSSSGVGGSSREPRLVAPSCNFEEEMKRPGVLEAEKRSTPTTDAAQDNLASLCHPPFALMYHGPFEKNLLARVGEPEVTMFSGVGSFRSYIANTFKCLHHLPPFSYSNTREEKIPKLAGVGKFKDLEKNDCNCSAVHSSRNEKGRSRLNTNAALNVKDECVLSLVATLLATVMHTAVSHLPYFIAKANHIYDGDTGRIVQYIRDSPIISSFILFNSIGFVASLAIVMSILPSLPLKPWTQMAVFMYYVSYMCMIMKILPLGSWLVLFLSVPLLLLAASGKLCNFAEERPAIPLLI
ncbi:uncharacterized protein [Nicotiana tomentosiformis]|uniref:uncharacterized protein isoform X1 n=1 Tax=Nicotiana tomentosiformis TaxID=4098 RepID=UPI00051BFCF3|nr:uncharacterized protein LOC104097000 isoform X1 [Nicotiana tomentosiformis]